MAAAEISEAYLLGSVILGRIPKRLNAAAMEQPPAYQSAWIIIDDDDEP